nr:uncharacterized protein LOC113743194 isoform X1 [Coffea arabica]XP_027126948.1 uncharacterized protein LOC113743194 isoform X1 [Coffea arabica]XP_027126949.1 uncharacterized protein LOC113743194 isoform X1 [Coffea arabica]
MPRISRIKDFLLLLFALLIFHLLFLLHHPFTLLPPLQPPPTTSLSFSHHLLFSISSSSTSLPQRTPYIHLWFSPNSTPNTYIFLDKNPQFTLSSTLSLPPVFLSSDTSHFPYTFPRGNPSAIRIAYAVKDVFTLLKPPPHVRWFVFCDDDTVFFPRNLALVLSKYDHNQWFYVGFGSESYKQNQKFSFDMAFGGGGFALSAPLARVLAEVLDSCLTRYPHYYGSDQRIFACLAELGVPLTREPGFHQIDVRGDLFGMLAAHPLSPLLSLHHMDAADPIFPGMNRIQALQHLFKAVNADSPRILQQTVCYDPFNSLTVSISWGFAVQVFEGRQLLPDLISLERTFRPWGRTRSVYSSHFMFNIRETPRDQCKRPVVFFMDSVASKDSSVWTNYTKHNIGSCVRINAVQKLETIRVFSKMMDYDIEEMKAPRRQCCDILSPIDETMTIYIRECRNGEVISMPR